MVLGGGARGVGLGEPRRISILWGKCQYCGVKVKIMGEAPVLTCEASHWTRDPGVFLRNRLGCIGWR